MANSNLAGDFYVVGVGASAGGLDALEKFFNGAPSDGGLAYIVIQHLSPDYKSLMADLLAKRTDMPVRAAEDGMLVEPNHVYLIPPKQSITIFHRKLYLTDREQGQLYLPIDIFFQSLAEDLEERSIGVILSGTGSDGTRGIRAIKEKGGLVIVQDEQSAKFDGMPRSAIATNLVDYILQPENMAREMLNYIQHPFLAGDHTETHVIAQNDDSLSKIFALLRSSSGVDFTNYKQTTMIRRIERRMSIKQIERLSDYLHLLYQTPSELNTLFREFLIGVTRFFRDPEAFDEIKKEVIPSIFAGKNRGDSIRVWVAGCSTGEEAYSLAILLTEFMETTGRHIDVKVFATDLDKNALEFAGKGIYPESIAADVSPEHLQNYFVKNGESYAVTRRVREMVIFAQQSIISDPPFSKVDLISCRNVLIYFQPILQKKVISAFQFALNQDGFLFLGTSETVGDLDNFFLSRSTKWKTFQYKGGFRPSLEDSHLNRPTLRLQPSIGRRNQMPLEDWRTIDNIQRGVIEAFLPPTAVVDENLNLIYVAGDLDEYLKVPSGGLFTANILKQAREGLSIPLSTAIHKVIKDQEEIAYRNIHIEGADSNSFVDLKARPFLEPSSRQRMVLIQFTSTLQTPVEHSELKPFDIDNSAQLRIQDLEHELQYTRESLQATVEELETSNEELQATNEELFAANEELQSTNEELHSVNEELITVNAEYHAKIQELTMLNEDINNLLSSTNVGTLFLDRDLRIRLFTSVVQQEIHVLSQDVGRPIGHVAHNLINCDLVYEAQQVLKSLASREMEVQNNRGRWYQMKYLPYYTLQNHVGGVVVTLTDITEFKLANSQLARLSVAVEQSPASILITNLEGVIEYVNPRFSQVTGYSAEEAIGQSSSILKSEMTPAEVHRQLWESIRAGKEWHGEFINKRKNGEYYAESAVVSPIIDEKGEIRQFLSVQMDLSKQKENENALLESREALRLNLEKYRLLFESFPLGITIADKNGQILESNRESERLLGTSKEAQSRRGIDSGEWQIVRPDGTPMPAEDFASVRALKENRVVENVKMGIVKEGGQITWLKVTAAPLSDYGVLVTYTETSGN